MAIMYDAIIIGSGQAGPATRGATGSRGDESGDHRAQALRRHLCQHWLHPHQNPDRQRARHISRAAPQIMA